MIKTICSMSKKCRRIIKSSRNDIKGKQFRFYAFYDLELKIKEHMKAIDFLCFMVYEDAFDCIFQYTHKKFRRKSCNLGAVNTIYAIFKDY